MIARFGITRFGAVLASAMLITACGGDSGSDSGDSTNNSDPTQIDGSTKAADLSRASAEGARQTKTQDSAPTTTVTSSVELVDSDPRDQLNTITRKLIDRVEFNDAVSGVTKTKTVEDNCSQSNGTADFDVDSFGTDGFESGTITYNNFCTSTVNDGTTINGTVDFDYAYESDGDLSKASFNYKGLEITDDATGDKTTVDADTTCFYTDGKLDRCEFSEKFTGTNGVEYEVKDAQLQGSGPYTLSARIFHPDYDGYIAVTTDTKLAFNCNSDFPSAGEVSFSDGNGNSVTVTFDDCSQFSWRYTNSSGGTTSDTVTY